LGFIELRVFDKNKAGEGIIPPPLKVFAYVFF